MMVLLLAGGGARLPFKGPGDTCLLIGCNQAAVQSQYQAAEASCKQVTQCSVGMICMLGTAHASSTQLLLQ
jgi:hypothetical protein